MNFSECPSLHHSILYIKFKCGSGPATVCHYVIFVFLWTASMGASLILKKLFSGTSFYDIACFSILASGPHLDSAITSENIFRSSCTDAIIFNCGPLVMNISLVLDGFFGRSRISPII